MAEMKYTAKDSVFSFVFRQRKTPGSCIWHSIPRIPM